MNISEIKNHVLNRIETSNINEYPFYNIYINNIFPDTFYQKFKDRMMYYKYNEKLQERNWDNPNFINKKLSLKDKDDNIIDIIREVFNDSDIKDSIMSKFYLNKHSDDIIFKDDMQFVFTDSDRFQTIHTDIPAQFISFNFFIPEDILTHQEEIDNGTILYDRDLNPVKVSKFVENSLSCFAPHFYSYHGFNTTIKNRNTLLFFYAQKDLFKRFYDNIHNENGEQSPDKFKDIFQWKISKYRLIEYGTNEMDFIGKLIDEKSKCRVNELNGRIKL